MYNTRKELAALIGKIAITDTEMQPKGTVMIDDKIFEAESLDGYVEAGRGVRVIRVRGKKLTVKKV
jgi:membrane-bound serine protease (ClpP class)